VGCASSKGEYVSYISNTKTILYTVTLLLALVAPVFAAVDSVVLSTPENSVWTTDTTPDFSFTATTTVDPVALACDVVVDATTVGNDSYTLNNTLTTITSNTTLSQGARSWYVQCTDSENTSVSATHTLNIDTTAPATTINAANATGTTDNTPEVNFTITDALDGTLNFTVYVNGAQDQNGTATSAANTYVNLSAQVNGTYLIIVQATDEANNTANSTALTLYVDTVVPTSVISSPINGSNTSDNAPPIIFTLTDNVDSSIAYVVYVDGLATAVTGTANNNTGTPVSLAALADGTHIVLVQATDDAGNAANSTQLTITVDTTSPSSTIVSPVTGLNTTDETPELSFNVSDNFAFLIAYIIYVDGSNTASGTVANGSLTYANLSALANGTHTVRVQATDEANNSVNSTAVSITVDTTTPTATISVPSNATNTSDSTPQLTFTISDAVDSSIAYVIYVDGVAGQTGSATNATATDLNITAVTNGTHAIIVQATDDAGNTANSTELTITVDTAVPTSTITSPTTGLNTTDSTPQITFTVSDNIAANIVYVVYVDGSNSATGTVANASSTDLNLSILVNGTHSVIVQATDDAGNAANSTVVSITVDTNNPTATISAPTNATNTTDSTPQITFTLLDGVDTALAYVVYVDAVAGQTGIATNGTATNLNISVLVNGTHSIIVQATDDAANAGNSTALTITIDTTAPTSTITSPTTGLNTTDNTPAVSFNITDSVDGVLAYVLYVDGAIDQSSTATNASVTTVSTAALGDGLHSIIVQATDAAGNTVNSTAVSVTVDTAVPSASISAPLNATNTSDSTPQLTFTISDAVDSSIAYVIYVDGVAGQTGSATNATATDLNITAVTNGTHAIIVQATDDAGNTANSTELTITVDTSAPSASISAPTTNSWTTDTTPTVTFTLTDNIYTNLSYVVYVNGTNTATGTAANGTPTGVDLSVGNGNFSIIVEATDSAGNAANSSAVVVHVDTAAPTSSISAPSTDLWTADTTPQITFTLTDNIDGTLNYTIYVDGSAIGPNGTTTNGTSTNVDLPTLTDVNHTVIVQATDEAGNTVNGSSIIIAVDTTNPSSTISSPINATTTSNATPQIIFTLVDVRSSMLNYTIYVDGSAVGPNGTATNNTATNANLDTLVNGEHTIYVEATDAANNTVNSSTLTLVVDTVIPTVSLVSPTNTSNLTNKTVTLVFNTTDNMDTNTSYVAYINGTTNNTGTMLNGTNTNFTITFAGDGIFTWIIQSTDNANNSGNSSAYVFGIDTTAPVQSNEDAVEGATSAVLSLDTNEVAICSYSTSNITYSAMTNNFSTTNTTTHQTTVSGLTRSTSYTYYVRCSDANNAATTPSVITFTTTSGSSGGSSGGGGGGSGYGVPSTGGVQYTRAFVTVTEGEEKTITITKAGIPVTSVVFTLGETKPDVEIGVKSLGEKSPVSTNAGAKVFKYLDISKKGITNENFDGGVTITFSVDKAWLTANNVNENAVELRRYTSQWDSLQTRVVSSSDTEVTYEAQTPGMSYFAIAANDAAAPAMMPPTPAAETTPVQQPVETTPQAPAAEPVVNEQAKAEPIVAEKGSSSKGIILGVVAAIAVAIVLVLFMRRK
jgi:large repetitive protein